MMEEIDKIKENVGVFSPVKEKEIADLKIKKEEIRLEKVANDFKLESKDLRGLYDLFNMICYDCEQTIKENGLNKWYLSFFNKICSSVENY